VFQNLYNLENDVSQPLGRLLRQAFSEGFRANGENGIWKFHARPTGQEFVVEVKSNYTPLTGVHHMIWATAEYKPGGDTAAAGAAGVHALSGIANLKSGRTMNGGSLSGLYGQFCNLGTMNGAGIFGSAIYGLIEDGGVFTEVSHLSALWLDSHLTKVVSAGKTEFLYISNNGSTVFDQAMYIWAGNKMTNLFRVDSSAGMITSGSGSAGGLKIQISLDGVPYFINVFSS
jgi:hypothetical protein